MPDPTTPESGSFADVLSAYEQSHTRGRGLEGTVVAVTEDSVLLDIGFKTEGILPLNAFEGEEIQPGDKLPVTVKGRDPEGYYQLARGRFARPTDWSALEQAFADKSVVMGTVTAVVKGGLSVDLGVRAFLPASRSGTRDAAELEKLVGQEIRCRITKLDVTDEDVVVDRRIVSEEEQRATKQRRYSELREGDTLTATVRNVTDYGAFVDLGGVDALLHVADISWTRIGKPADVLSPGQQVEVRVLKVDPEKRRIAVGLKQLQAHPWDAAAGKYKPGDRIRGTVTRLTDFGAFVELEPGVEGLIHISEMSWAKKLKRPSDVVNPGETVEAVILGVNPADRRIALGLKQALGDPWAEVPRRFAVGSVVEAPVSSIQKFGAFVQLAEGVEGMIHVSDISADKRINHPQDVLKLGQPVKAQVLEVDPERRRLRLGMKQLVPTTLEEYIAEHQIGDVVTGRLVELTGATARVELAEGVHGACRVPVAAAEPSAATPARADLSSLTSMLQARWKGAASTVSRPEAARAGQVRSFRITRLDPAAKQIALDLAD
jgi:small subunit ribosomal protein S1